MDLIPYLSFDGDCREAFEFYADALGGEIQALMTWGDSPMAGEEGGAPADAIMHACLAVNGQYLMGSDAFEGCPYEGARGMQVNINVETPEQAERVFTAISAGGQVTMELQETFWARRFGALVDRYGVPWMVNCSKEN